MQGTLEQDVRKLSAWEWVKLKLQERFKAKTDEEVFDEAYDYSDIEPTIVGEIIGAFLKVVVLALVTSLVIQIGFAVYSAGGLVQMLALSMASLCLSGGSCSQPVLLTSITLGLLLTVGITLIIIGPVRLVRGKSQWTRLHEHIDSIDSEVDRMHEEMKDYAGSIAQQFVDLDKKLSKLSLKPAETETAPIAVSADAH
jgi:hypothetical protein